MNKRFLLPCILAILIVAGIFASIRPAHAAPWTIILDANSTGATDANPQASFTFAKTFSVGAILGATSTNPITGVFGWQISIIYDNTTVVPQGDPVVSSATDGAASTAVFGANTGTGQVSWAGKILANQGFGSSTIVDPKIDNHHSEIQVFFTILNPFLAVNISPVATAAVQGNLLANVAFEVLKPATGLSFSLDAANTQLVDSSAHPISGIVAGAS